MGKTTPQRMLRDENPTGDVAINDLELAVYVVHLHIFAPLIAPLEHISTKVDNNAVKSWARRGSERQLRKHCGTSPERITVKFLANTSTFVSGMHCSI